MQRVSITTLGCRLNQFESDALERRLTERGYTLVGVHEHADVHILNTCTITHQADQEASGLMRKLHRSNPAARIVVTGCYATASAAEVAKLPGVALVIGNGEKDRLVQHLEHLSPGHTEAHHGPASRTLTAHLPPAVAPRRSRAYLKVQDGCDYRCSFCIVPMVRGKSRSLAPETLLAQLDSLVQAKVAEVVLTGVHLGTYGRDLTPRLSLVDLLTRMLPRLGKDCRLRLGSLDPHEVSDALIALMANNPRALCPYLHLPVQSADPGILRRMRRAHTVEDLTQLVPKLTTAMPRVAIGSDVIVGFPHEGEQEFNNTLHVLQDLPMSYLHVFSYSNRQGTTASQFAEQVPAPEIARRSRLLRALSAAKRQAFTAQQIGRQCRVVVHRQRSKSGSLVGITDNYVRVHFAGPDELMGGAADLQLLAAGPDSAEGQLITTGYCG